MLWFCTILTFEMFKKEKRRINLEKLDLSVKILIFDCQK